MAEMALQVVVSPLVKMIFDKLSTPALNEFGLLWGVHGELQKLSNTSSTIQLVLQDAEMKQNHDKGTKDWLRKLKEAAYDADDIIDECEAEALFSPDSEIASGNFIIQVRGSFSTCFDFKRLKLRHRIAKRIREVRENFDEIAAERSKFHLNQMGLESRLAEESVQYRESSSTMLEACIYGRDADKDKIINSLLGNTSDKNDLQVYSIVGIGGLGKTTLTQCVYNDTSIKENFDPKIWVCVSEDFSATRLMKVIIESISGKGCRLENLDALQSRLKGLLSRKKFLLVLDDVWNEDPGKWDMLKFSLKCGAKGSSVIVTTRQSNVAEIMGACLVYQLAPLSDEECWSLFKGRAFGEENIKNRELEMVGKDIVRKCAGVPLAAKALGGTLRFEREVNVWVSIRNSKIWELHEDNRDGGILPSLRLSYNHLPSGLQRCFAYCSVFPKSYEIRVAELTQLWMANGLLPSWRGMELEDVGRQIFNQLLTRSFFQNVSQDGDGMMTVKMHDLMHDLACFVGGECLACDGGDILSNIRHLSIPFNYPFKPEEYFKTLGVSHPFLRTFLKLKPPSLELPTPDNCHFSLENLNCLRALDLSHTPIQNLPVSIGRMKHLRYLNLSFTLLVHLPASLCELKMLQTLKLRWCAKLEMLPKNMNNLVNLIHLDLWKCRSLIQMPLGIGEWVQLRTLGCFVVGPGSGQSIKELHGLKHLGGDLTIRGLEHVRDAAEAKEANLAAKRNLSRLTLEWNSQENANSEKVLEALHPHQDFRGAVRISGYTGSSYPSWIKNLVNLVDIILNDFFNCEDLPLLGHLPFLKKLSFFGMHSLKRIKKEFYGTSSSQGFFPSLEQLTFYNIQKWQEWQVLDGEQVFPSLKKLQLVHCPKLALLPSPMLYAVQEIHVTDCEKLTVRSLPCLRLLYANNLSSFQDLEALESLEFCAMKFSSMPQQIKNLTSLKSLNIGDCQALKSLSRSLQHLSSLETLHIHKCNQLEFSSDDFQNLIALQNLTLNELPKLTSFPDIQHLSTLQNLEVNGCKNLRVLPQWLQNLKSLHTVGIRGCHPDLHVRCSRDEATEQCPHRPPKNSAALINYLTKEIKKRTAKGCHPDLDVCCKKDEGRVGICPTPPRFHASTLHLFNDNDVRGEPSSETLLISRRYILQLYFLDLDEII